ncbi:hypothetical protein NDU88_009546 [Pleurodeles waltl]|uniref:Uncharacterized protein n=1 Tax=Pleurodeles waltl TaxID=8319 RepID=A0AAV7PVJ2_PLEWA|nr:hypothetical protein NDU88_009546 [Pleurodeles waltl]
MPMRSESSIHSGALSGITSSRTLRPQGNYNYRRPWERYDAPRVPRRVILARPTLTPHPRDRSRECWNYPHQGSGVACRRTRDASPMCADRVFSFETRVGLAPLLPETLHTST